MKQLIGRLVMLNDFKNKTKDLSVEQTKSYFDNILYNLVFEYALEIKLEEFVELINFLEATELSLEKIRLKNDNLTSEKLINFYADKYIDCFENEFYKSEQVRERIFEDYLEDKGFYELVDKRQIISLIEKSNYLSDFKSKYFLTNKGLEVINDLLKFYNDIRYEKQSIKIEVLVDKLLSNKESLVYYSYNYKNHLINSNRPLSKELFEILVECTNHELEHTSINYNSINFKFTKDYTSLKATYIHNNSAEYNSTVYMSLKIECLSENLKVNDINDILFIRWLTFRHKSSNEEITGWLKGYEFENMYEATKKNFHNGNLIIAPLEVQVETLLTTNDLKQIFKINQIKNYSTLSKGELVKLFIENTSSLNVNQILQGKRVYILSLKGINLCDNLYRYLPKSIRECYEYDVFFVQIEWDYDKEINKLKEYSKNIEKYNKCINTEDNINIS